MSLTTVRKKTEIFTISDFAIFVFLSKIITWIEKTSKRMLQLTLLKFSNIQFFAIKDPSVYMYTGGRPDKSLPVMLTWLWALILCSVDSGHQLPSKVKFFAWIVGMHTVCTQEFMNLHIIIIYFWLRVNLMPLFGFFKYTYSLTKYLPIKGPTINLPTYLIKCNQASWAPGAFQFNSPALPLNSYLPSAIKKQRQFQLISSNWAADVICNRIVRASVHL